jgi:8-oxo-dGTP diphosphatase
MKHIHVACGIIEHNGLVLAAQRSASMSLPLKWEFPGGKIHEDESPQQCLTRELLEELGVEVEIQTSFAPSTHHYPTFIVTLYPYRCTIPVAEIVLAEHAQVAWLAPQELLDLDWAAADVPVVRAYLELRDRK